MDKVKSTHPWFLRSCCVLRLSPLSLVPALVLSLSFSLPLARVVALRLGLGSYCCPRASRVSLVSDLLAESPLSSSTRLVTLTSLQRWIGGSTFCLAASLLVRWLYGALEDGRIRSFTGVGTSSGKGIEKNSPLPNTVERGKNPWLAQLKEDRQGEAGTTVCLRKNPFLSLVACKPVRHPSLLSSVRHLVVLPLSGRAPLLFP